MKKFFRVAITTGDLDGIGLEIAAKALAQIKPQRNIQFYLWRGPQASQRDLKRIDRYFNRFTVRDWPQAMQASPDYHRSLIDIESPISPASWVELMAKSAVSGSIDALVTAPLSKTEILRAGYKDKGHTGILKRVSKTKNVYMSFLGKEMNVTLLTGHTSIKKAYDQINESLLKDCIEKSMTLTSRLSSRFRKKPLGVVGCNPHAGEEGVIDDKEKKVYLPAIKKFRQRKWSIEGPLVPDVCFQEKMRKNFSSFIASYHDQGLIPFKMLHGTHSGIQMSLGLPFVRTSVNHGTAKDIFGKDRANCGSMAHSIDIAIKLIKEKTITW